MRWSPSWLWTTSTSLTPQCGSTLFRTNGSIASDARTRCIGIPSPDGTGFWAVTKYEDLRFVSKRPDLFSSAMHGCTRQDLEGDALAQMRMIIIGMDPPEHRLNRDIVSKAFTPRMISRIEPLLRRETQRVLGEIGPRGECEFVHDFAARIPMWSISELMGVPESDRMHLFELRSCAHRRPGSRDRAHTDSERRGQCRHFQLRAADGRARAGQPGRQPHSGVARGRGGRPEAQRHGIQSLLPVSDRSGQRDDAGRWPPMGCGH